VEIATPGIMIATGRGPSRRRVGAVIGVGVLAALASTQLRRSRPNDSASDMASGVGPRGVGAERAIVGDGASGAPRHTERTEVPLVTAAGAPKAAGVTTCAAYLASYWGDEWEALRAEIAADEDLAWALTRELTPEQVPKPWEEVKDLVRADFAASEADKAGFAASIHDIPRNGYAASDVARIGGSIPVETVTEADVAAVADIAGPFDLEIQSLAREYADEVASAIERAFRTDEVRRGPLVMPGTMPSFDRIPIAGKGITSHGWYVGLLVYAEDHPELAALRQAAGDLIRRRNAAIREYLAGR
jgi:hypothetical protein